MKAITLVVFVTVTGLAGCVDDGFIWPEPGGQAGAVEALLPGLSLVPVASGFDRPVHVLSRGPGTLWVAEQPGRIADADGATVLDLRDLTAPCHYEQGLLGIATQTDARLDGRLFVTHTDLPCDDPETGAIGDLLLAVYPVDNGTVDPAGRQELLRIGQPYRNHNGGHIVFGPDGMLYLGVGDGGHHGDPLGHGRDPSTPLGAILRLAVNGTAAVPAPGNPFLDAGGDPRVWAYGLRNPWRFSFDGQSGDLWVGDVGQDCFEEIDRIPSGAGGVDLGWSRYEGPFQYPVEDCSRPRLAAHHPDFIWPEHAYPHQPGGHCSVTGGLVVRADDTGPLDGHYVFGDWCSGAIWALPVDDGPVRQVFTTDLRVASFGVDAEGDVLVVHHAPEGAGTVYRLEAPSDEA